ncbi:MAG TPA: beta-ketoacyl-ACP synthase III [Sphaerochaeta sp.]|nr:beta-ketoacyl-ACP synthase III [Sphaerochaeta sp.]
MKSPQPIYISAIGHYVPKKIVTNTDLAQSVDTSDEWIHSHTGIRERRIAEQDERCSDLAVKAALDLFAKSNRNKDEIDGIVVATATADHYGFPSTACIVAEKLGIKGAAALDIGAGCTGFIYALEVARGMIMSGSMTKALVFGSEKLSEVVNWKDRNTCVLFGDGAGCVLLERTDEQKGIIDSTLHAEGKGSLALAITQDTQTITMDGRSVYAFAVRAIGDTVLELLKRNDLTIEDITWIVPHQANKRIIAACSKRYGIDASLFYMNIERYANTSAASIPIALAEMEERGLLKSGQKILFVGFGAGLTYGGTLIQW